MRARERSAFLGGRQPTRQKATAAQRDRREGRRMSVHAYMGGGGRGVGLSAFGWLEQLALNG